MKNLTLTIPMDRAHAYINALELAITLLSKDIKHLNGADFLAELRGEMIETYVDAQDSARAVNSVSGS